MVATARHDLPGVEKQSVVPARVDRAGFDAARASCRTDRISGLLAGAVRTGEVVVESTDTADDVMMSIDGEWQDALHACVILEALLLRVGERLDDEGIRWMVSKGPAVSHLDYPNPALRTFADVDLLVHPDDWSAAVALLAEASSVRPWHLRYVERYGKGLTVLVDDMEVDLHRRFAVGRFGVRCVMRECFDAHDRIELAGRGVRVPTAPYRLLHGCFHAALGGDRELRAFRDVAQIALGRPDSVAETWRIARRWQVEAVVAAAIIETWDRLRLPHDHRVVVEARSVRIGPTDRRALDVFARNDTFRRQALTTFGSLPLRDLARFAWTTWMMSRERRA